jgi:hypothetical protein
MKPASSRRISPLRPGGAQPQQSTSGNMSSHQQRLQKALHLSHASPQPVPGKQASHSGSTPLQPGHLTWSSMAFRPTSILVSGPCSLLSTSCRRCSSSSSSPSAAPPASAAALDPAAAPASLCCRCPGSGTGTGALAVLQRGTSAAMGSRTAAGAEPATYSSSSSAAAEWDATSDQAREWLTCWMQGIACNGMAYGPYKYTQYTIVTLYPREQTPEATRAHRVLSWSNGIHT